MTIFRPIGMRPTITQFGHALLEGIHGEVEAYMTTVLKGLRCPPLAVGVATDHGHAALVLARDVAVATLVRELKVATTNWLKTRDGSLAEFAWQNGYAAFSARYNQRDALVHYVRNQREHHKKESFQDELRRLLTWHEIAYDERYLWD